MSTPSQDFLHMGTSVGGTNYLQEFVAVASSADRLRADTYVGETDFF
jgi:hypothetical protein